MRERIEGSSKYIKAATHQINKKQQQDGLNSETQRTEKRLSNQDLFEGIRPPTGEG